mmetsp:Transcript_4454/g.9870  ORF Transcript_4454/g.9870 Transcript_4454/m.9870 type:complete len:209 (-) Transcript_4454:1098-1724(-)
MSRRLDRSLLQCRERAFDYLENEESQFLQEEASRGGCHHVHHGQHRLLCHAVALESMHGIAHGHARLDEPRKGISRKLGSLPMHPGKRVQRSSLPLLLRGRCCHSTIVPLPRNRRNRCIHFQQCGTVPVFYPVHHVGLIGLRNCRSFRIVRAITTLWGGLWSSIWAFAAQTRPHFRNICRLGHLCAHGSCCGTGRNGPNDHFAHCHSP